ncbi:MAG: hypothetical protein JNK65_04430 [Deltaproteobacteria bacterium]|nr:hypothetical protein [Deltaproteobacteria bacterium]
MPDLKEVYIITEKAGLDDGPSKSVWTKIGVAHVNRDQSLNVILDAIPMNGRLHIRDKRISKTVVD